MQPKPPSIASLGRFLVGTLLCNINMSRITHKEAQAKKWTIIVMTMMKCHSMIMWLGVKIVLRLLTSHVVLASHLALTSCGTRDNVLSDLGRLYEEDTGGALEIIHSTY